MACVCHVDEEVEMAEEICTKYGLLDIREDEYPMKGMAETEIKGDGLGTISHGWSAVDCM